MAMIGQIKTLHHNAFVTDTPKPKQTHRKQKQKFGRDIY